MVSKREKTLNVIVPLFSVGCLFAVWAILASVNNQNIFPTIGEVFINVWEILKTKTFYLELGSTLLRSLIAFAVAYVSALLIALLCKRFKRLKGFFMPIIAILRALPTVAVVLLLLYFTTSNIAPVVVTFLVVFPTTFNNMANALDTVSNEQITMCNTFNVSKKDIFFKVQLPQVAPYLLTAAGSGLSLNVKLMVAAEALAHTANCLGYRFNMINQFEPVAKLTALVLLTVVVCLIVEGVFYLLSKRVGRWK